jgi:hypothetical protein
MIFHALLLVPACHEIILWINHNYNGEIYPVPHEIMEIENWTLKMTIWNGLEWIDVFMLGHFA